MSVAVTDTHALIWYAVGPSRRLGRQARALFDRAERGQATIFVPVLVTSDVVFEAERLYGIPERGDRLIAATAAALGYPLITSDPQIARHAGVSTIW